jgi:hypothetical protein
MVSLSNHVLSEALMSRIANGEAIPEPSRVGRHQYQCLEALCSWEIDRAVRADLY